MNQTGLSRRAFITSFLGLPTAFIYAGDAPRSGMALSRPDFARYGAVIYRKNESAPNQLYIVCQTHRDANNRNVVETTPRVQMEVYRLGEQLIAHHGVQLVLGEGYLADTDSYPIIRFMRTYADPRVTITKTADDSTLESIMDKVATLDTSSTMNMDAVNLLAVNYPTLDIQGLSTVEDTEMKRRILQEQKRGMPVDVVLRYLDFAGEMISGRMLLNAPKVIGRERKLMRIRNRNAMMTIGGAHFDELIEFVRGNDVRISDLVHNGTTLEKGATYPLTLDENNYGVTIIVPRSMNIG